MTRVGAPVCGQSMHPQRLSKAKGVLGRMLNSLKMRRPDPYKTQAYSASGNAKALEGGPRPQIIPSGGGAPISS